MSIRIFTGALLIALLSSCSLFGHKHCAGADCYVPKLLENTNAAHKWYCYGEESGNWKCLTKPDHKLIVAVKPKYQAAVNPDQVPGASTPLATNKHIKIAPLMDITNSILGQSENSYTVQLTASRSKKGLEEYARDHEIIHPVYVKVPGDNGPTYILLLGVYGDQDKALDARELWERTRRLEEEPWVRKLGPLQKAIQAKDQDG